LTTSSLGDLAALVALSPELIACLDSNGRWSRRFASSTRRSAAFAAAICVTTSLH